MSRRAVIMVAGGTGTRMGAPRAKQFLPLAGKPIIFHTFEAFFAFDPHMQFVLVLFPSLRAEWEQLTKDFDFQLDHTVVDGGAERFHSVKNGIAALDGDVDLVAIHDAVRPLVSPATIAHSFEAAALHGAAVPVVPVVDTIRQVADGRSATLDRNALVAVQTPQCFRKDLIKGAYDVEYQPGFTDDASVAERAGHYVHLCEGNRSNIKVTTPEDMWVAEALRSGGSPLS